MNDLLEEFRSQNCRRAYRKTALMSKKKSRQEQHLQRKPLLQQSTKAKHDSRTETIALAVEHAASPVGRERTRAYIKDCGSPVIAAKGVFLTYAQAAEKSDPRYAIACHAGCWFCCTIPVAVTVFEAAMVRSAVHALPEEEQQVIWERLEEHISLQNQAVTDANGKHIPFQHRCPLLSDEGRCSVYEG